jgi:penicillin-binding protein 2
MPDAAWKSAMFHTPADLAARNDQWYLGDTYHVSIGQGYLLTTPIQVNAWTNIIASGGKLCRPTILKIQNSMTGTQGNNCKSLGIKNETIDIISKGLTEACAPGGTGWPLFDFGIKRDANGIATSSGTLIPIPVACKTGTAEFGDPKNRTHAWFTTYAPLKDPELSITVLVEGAGEGSNVAAPVAKQIYEEWFSR